VDMLTEKRTHEKYIDFVKMWIDIIYSKGPPEIVPHSIDKYDIYRNQFLAS